MRRHQDNFLALLSGFNFKTLETDPGSIFALSPDLRLIYFNPSWFAFATSNNGEPAISERFPLGTFIGDAISGPARDYYLEAFANSLRTGKIWHHEYECSSPELFRLYHQSVYPQGNRQGLVVVNSLVKEVPLVADSANQLPEHELHVLYVQKNGYITQCSNCRRVQRVAQREMWDWVPAWVREMPEKTSHSFCRICFEYYYEFRIV